MILSSHRRADVVGLQGAVISRSSASGEMERMRGNWVH